MTNEIIYVGIDGGASHCRANVYDANLRLLGQGRAGPANPVNGLQQTQSSILQAISQALQAAGLADYPLQKLVVGAGLAGLHLTSQRQAMAAWQHPFRQLYLTTDLHAALLGALAGKDGGVIIMGTGFSALAVVNGQQYPIGGYGFPINATASGSWFGLEVIKAVLHDFDGVGEATSLTQAVLAGCDVFSLAEKMNNAPAQDFATFAPLVFAHAKQGDSVSMALIKQAAAYIDGVIQQLSRRGANSIALVGGVAPFIQPWLQAAHQNLIVAAQASPEYGVMLWAQQQFLIKQQTSETSAGAYHE